MADVTIIGSGNAARACADVLVQAGFRLHHAFDAEDSDRSPVVLGEVQGMFSMARQVVEAGRHLLLANPLSLQANWLPSLLEGRNRNQAIFIWNERRHHPAYRFVSSLVGADSVWQPVFLRLETMSSEPPTANLVQWRLLESISLVQDLTGATPVSVSARAAHNTLRNADELLDLHIDYAKLTAFVHLSMNEPVERRDLTLSGTNRKAYVDELNQSVPVRLVEMEPGAAPNARWVSCPPPSPEELARQQCLSFLEATMKPDQAEREGQLWSTSFAMLAALETSLVTNGAIQEVDVKDQRSLEIRVLQQRQAYPPSPPIPA